MKFDITILTDHRYVNPQEEELSEYVSNVLLEDQLLLDALTKKGFKVARTNWDNPTFDWSSTRYALFRTTWDYFDRFDEFEPWLKKVEQETTLLNSSKLLYWNIDKHYLQDLQDQGVNIPATVFLEKSSTETLVDAVIKTGWKEVVLKPVISGAGRHTYRFRAEDAQDHESIFQDLIKKEAMMIQAYQNQITSKGEVALVFFGDQFSHAILKKAKPGDFRVQDDFGGTVHDYEPSNAMIEFAKNAISKCPEAPLYARVDLIWDNNDAFAVSELELIEPELWFRKSINSTAIFTQTIFDRISK